MALGLIAAIALTGLAANDPVPADYVEINFAQGDVAGSASDYPIIVLANKLSTGSATVDTVIYGPDTPDQLQTEADMIRLAGSGSEAHRMYLRMTRVNRDTAIYFVFVTESAGAKATGTITLATTAIANGTLRIFVGDESVDTGFIAGDTPTVIATAAVANINARSKWGVTASNASGVITITAKQNGLRGNWIRFMSQIIAQGAVGVTSTALVDAFLTGGTTADSNATALATIAPRSDYRVVSAAEDATQFGAVVTQVNLDASPTTGINRRAYAGCVDTLANGITVATGINATLAQIIWQEKSPWTPAELAANHAAVVALFETYPNPRTNFVKFGGDAKTAPYWLVPKSRVATAAASRASLKSALNNGLSPIANTRSGTVLVNNITTRSLNGSTQDYRIRAAHKVTICHFFADAWKAKSAAQNAGKKIGNNPAKGQPPPPPDVLYPDLMAGQLIGLIRSFEANALLERVDETIDSLVVQREQNPSTRMGARVPLHTIDNLEQTATALDQVS